MTQNELLRLKRVLNGLAGETWNVSKASARMNVCAESNGGGFCPAVAHCSNEKIARFIATFDPVTIERLLAEIEASRQPLPEAA